MSALLATTAVARTFKPSVHQQRIFNFVEKGTGSAIVKAVAGSGKSTTVVGSLEFIPESKSVQLFAFNANIAAELKTKIAALGERLCRPFRNVRSSTFHSVGLQAILRKLDLPAAAVKPDPSKVIKIAQAILGDDELELYGAFAAKLVSFAKGEGFGAIVGADEEKWLGLIRHHDLYLDSEDASEERAVAIARDLLRRSNDAGKTGSIDFDDMLYLPLLWRCRLFANDFVFVDEAQDTNPVRRAIAKLALKPGGRLIAVGDPKQAIYGFTGASSDALDLIAKEFRTIELPLTVSYRCPRAVGEKARELVPYFETAATAVEGAVIDMPLKDAVAILGPKDAILCRNLAPLLKVAFGLIGRGIGCAVRGKDMSEGLVSLIKKMRAREIDGLVELLGAWRDREVAKFTARGEEAKAEAATDRCAAIETVIDNLDEGRRTIPALIERLRSMFDEKTGVLSLSTIHGVKGKEYPNVAILRPDLMPSKWARQDHQYEQELNLMYVAWTRTMGRLMMLTTEDFR